MDSTKFFKGLPSVLKHLFLVALFSFVYICNVFAISGTGTEADPYKVTSVADWNDLRGRLNRGYIYVELENDITLSTTTYACPLGGSNGQAWMSSTTKFSGNFNGNRHTITVNIPNFTPNQMNTNGVGLFGEVDDATIINLNVKYASAIDKIINNSNNNIRRNFGALVGNASKTTIEKCNVVVDFKININKNITFGGIVGNATNCEIVDCTIENSKVNLSGNLPHVGGICGQASNTNISNCHVINTTLNAPNASGIASMMTNGTIKECSFTGAIGPNNKSLEINNSGGVCGEVVAGLVKIYNSYSRFDLNASSPTNFGYLLGLVDADANVEIMNCYTAGSVNFSEKGTGFGTAIGQNNGTYVVDNCFVQTDESNLSGNNGDVNAIEKDILFMKSGCLAELLNEYAKDNKDALQCSGVPMWFDDKENINDRFAVLRNQTKDIYLNDEVFCHPNVFTLEQASLGDNKFKLNGELEYITDEQKTEGWTFGFIVKEGRDSIILKVSDIADDKFSNEHSISGKKTATYRAFVQEPGNGRVATGQEFTLLSVEQKDEEVFDCDTAEYEGNKYFADTTFFDEDNNINVIITVGKTTYDDLSDTKLITKNCDSWIYKETVYSNVGHYVISTTKNSDGCNHIKFIDVVGLGSPVRTIEDSVYVMTLDDYYNNNGKYEYKLNYKYEKYDTLIAEIGNEFVLRSTPLKDAQFLLVEEYNKQSIKDVIKKVIPDACGKDSIKIKNISYVSPIRKTTTSEVLCDTTFAPTQKVTVGGKEYNVSGDTTIVEVKVTKYDIANDFGIDSLYEIVEHNFTLTKVTIEDKVSHGQGHRIDMNCKETLKNPCEKTTDSLTFYRIDKTYYNTATDAIKDGCPSAITIENWTYDPCDGNPTIKVDTTVCGEFMSRKGTIYNKSQKNIREDGVEYAESCTGQANFVYNLTVLQPTEKDSTIHSCDSVVYINQKGENIIFKGIGVYDDTLEVEGKCPNIVHVKYLAHTVKRENHPLTDCNKVEYTDLSGIKRTFTKDTTYSDILRVNCDKGCTCDSIIRNVVITVGNDTKKPLLSLSGCDKYEYKEYGMNVVATRDTMFEVPLPTTSCAITLPVEIKIHKTTSRDTVVVACESFSTPDGWETTKSDVHKLTYKNEYGCVDTLIYNISIGESKTLPDTTVYGCESYTYTKLDGTSEKFTDNATFTDFKSLAGCTGVGVSQNVKVEIYKPTVTTQPGTFHCGSMMFTIPSTGKKVSVTESTTISDTTFNDKGCPVKILNYPIVIRPVDVTRDTKEFCKEAKPSDYVIGNTRDYPSYSLNDERIVTDDYVFTKPSTNILSWGCQDTIYRRVVIHGVKESNLPDIKACEEYEYTKMDGSTEKVTTTGLLSDTLKSKTCDCDSLINHVNIVINHNSPYNPLAEELLPAACDSVVYERGAKRLVFDNNNTFTDTLVNMYGCDSMVNYKVVVNHSQLTKYTYTVCRDTNITGIDTKIIASGIYRIKTGTTLEGCDIGEEYDIIVNVPEVERVHEKACGSINFQGRDYVSANGEVNEIILTVGSTSKCAPDTLYTLSVYPTYDITIKDSSCFEVTFDDKVFSATKDSIVNEVFTYKTLAGGCDSIIHFNAKIFAPDSYGETVKEYYLESKFRKDTIVKENRVTPQGCDYVYTKNYVVIPPAEVSEDVNICRIFSGPNKELAIYNGVKYKNDTTFVEELLHNKTNEDTLRTINIFIHEPQHAYIDIDSCMHVTYEGKEYTDSTELKIFDPTLKTQEFGCDSIVHIRINVERCFPYPVLVNKYGWILVCNDNIMTEDKYRKLDGVKYRWYKDDNFITETSENFYTENKALSGCYYVAVLTQEGYEYSSDVMCIEPTHSVSLAPNPVDKGKALTIDCNFTKEPVEGTIVEVFNSLAVKVYETKATSSTILVPGKAISAAGHYFVKLTTEEGSVITTKFVVK